MDTKQLPAHPSLEHYKKQAEDLCKEHASGHPDALSRIRKNHPRLGELEDSDLRRLTLIQADAQLILAREHGFESWPKFARHIERLNRQNSPVSIFESAVDAIVAGDAVTLECLLREHPELIQCKRSMRVHRATLLHYVGANGVENYRQKTPKNAVQIARILLRAGADIQAQAEIYGGSDTLGLAATSVHPYLTGVQEALIDVLLEHGADLRTERLVNGCLANGRGRAAEHLAKRGAALDLEGAAGVGRLDLVKTFFNEDNTLRASATRLQMETGFMWACQYGRTAVVEFLLQMGVKVDAMPRGETGLHWAAYAAHVKIVKRLLGKKPSLEVKDKRFASTPLEWAIHGWSEPPLEAEPDSSRHYYTVVALLIAAGGRLNPAWLETRRNTRLLEKMRAHPRMMAALKGEKP